MRRNKCRPTGEKVRGFEVYEVDTERGVLRFYRNWDNDGTVTMLNARTVGRYRELWDRHPDLAEYGVWCAFTEEAFEEGRARAVAAGKMSAGDRVSQYVSGVYGTERNLARLRGFYQAGFDLIAEECDPQEVYFLEYNNFECCYDWDGDRNAYERVAHLFGEEAAARIARI